MGRELSGTEKAVPDGELSDGIGTFDVSGTNPNGSTYQGKLTITKGDNDVYQFAWETSSTFIGTGVRMGDYFAAVWARSNAGSSSTTLTAIRSVVNGAFPAQPRSVQK